MPEPKTWVPVAVISIAVVLLLRAFACSQGSSTRFEQVPAKPDPPGAESPQTASRTGDASRHELETNRQSSAGSERREPDGLLVTVVSGSTRLSDAEVSLTADDVDLEHRTTDALGRVRLELDRHASRFGLALVARKSGFGQECLPVPRHPPTEIEIQLSPAGIIRGRVRLPDGSAPAAGMRVFAWSTVGDPSARSIRATEPRSGRLFSCVAGERGQFHLEGLSTRRTYSLAAGGQGHATPEVTRGIQTGTYDADLIVRPLFGAEIHLESTASAALPDSTLWTIGHDDPQEFQGAEPIDFHLALAGAAGPASGRSDWRSFIRVGYGSDDPRTLPEVGLDYQIPGFRPTRVRLALPHVKDQLARHVARIEPPDSELAAIRLDPGTHTLDEWHEAHGTADGLWLSAHWAELHGDGREFRVPLDRLSVPSITIRGVPVGHYRIRIYAAGAYWAWPPRDTSGFPVDLQASGLEIPLPVEELGHIALEPAEIDFDRRSGELAVVATRVGDRRREATFVFRHGPYLVSDLPEGRYDLRLESIIAYTGAGLRQIVEIRDVEVRRSELRIESFAWDR
jgi:hypothetical protein